LRKPEAQEGLTDGRSGRRTPDGWLDGVQHVMWPLGIAA